MRSIASIAFLLVACGSETAPSAPAPAAPESRTERATPERTAPEPTPSDDRAAPAEAQRPPPPEELQRRERQARDALRRGRLATRRRDREGAIAAFRASIQALPLASAQCELGWALFQSGQHDEAEAPLRAAARSFEERAIMGAREQSTYAACLYNLGRVHEARAQNDEAIAVYRRSLRLRPNDTVRSRLEALAGEGASAPTSAECTPTPCVGPIAGELSALTAHQLSEDVRARPPEGATERAPRALVLRPPVRVSETPELWTAVFDTEVPRSRYGVPATYAYLAVRTDAGWFACPVGGGVPESYGEAPSAGETRASQIVPGGAPELSVDVSFEAVGYEDGCHNTMGITYTYFAGIEADRPVVYGFVRTADYYQDCEFGDCSDECEDGPLASCCEDITQIEVGTYYDLVDAPAGLVRFRQRAPVTRDAPLGIERPLRSLACE